MIDDFETLAWIAIAGLIGYWLGTRLGWSVLEGLFGVAPV